MFATRSELLEKIRLGEDNFLELKEVRFAGGKIRGPEQNDLADELAAFANSRGGVLLLGVPLCTSGVSNRASAFCSSKRTCTASIRAKLRIS